MNILFYFSNKMRIFTLRAWISKYKKLIIVTFTFSLMIIILSTLIIFFASKYLDDAQSKRDNSTKCKSYRALVEIAAAYYNNNPEGTDWIQKRNEAEKRKEQYGCSDHIFIGSQ